MRFTPLLALLLAVAAPATTHALDINSCGQEVPDGDVGRLVADLTCGSSGYGVLLHAKTTLDLNAHTITGGAIGVYLATGKRITIEGPGEIAGSQEVGIYAPNNIGRVGVEVRDGVVLHDHGIAGIALGQGNRVKLRLDDVTVRDNAGGAIADCNGLRLKADHLTVTDNGAGLCGDGIKLKHATITGNGVAGIFSWTARVKLIESTVTGNDAGGDGFDIATHRRPSVVDSTCGRSVQVPPFPGQPTASSPSWGVCTGD